MGRKGFLASGKTVDFKARPPLDRARRRGLLTFAKFSMLAIALSILAYLGYFWWGAGRDQVIDSGEMEEAVVTSAPVTVGNVEFDGKDDLGRPYSILARSASHPQSDSKHVSLVEPSADMILSKGAYVAIQADRGTLDRDANKVTLEGKVNLFHDDGLAFKTEKATIDLDTKDASGQSPVEGQNKDGELISEGFTITNNGDVVLFTGHAHLKLYGDVPAKQDQPQ